MPGQNLREELLCSFINAFLYFNLLAWFFAVKSRRDFYILCHRVERVSERFPVESLGALGSSDIFGSPDQPANETTIFHVVWSFAATNCVWNEKVSHRWLPKNLYSFLSITRQKFLSTCQVVVSKEFWRFFDDVRCFYINWSAPQWMEPFVWW